MIDYRAAVEAIRTHVSAQPPTRLALRQSGGLVLAGPVGPMPPGVVMTAARLAAAEAEQALELSVYPPPRVALCGGGEWLAAAVELAGLILEESGPAGGSADRIEKTLKSALNRNDLVIVSGTEPEEAAEAVRRVGGQSHFDEVAIAPGGRTLLASIGGTGQRAWRRHVLVLPGEPVDDLVAWVTLGSLVVAKLMGRPVRPDGKPVVLAISEGQVEANLSVAESRITFVPAVLRPAEKFAAWRVRPIGPFDGTPDDAARLAEANALMVRPAGAGPLASRAVCETIPLETMI